MTQDHSLQSQPVSLKRECGEGGKVDIVERLRDQDVWYYSESEISPDKVDALCTEAADEITTLRRALAIHEERLPSPRNWAAERALILESAALSAQMFRQDGEPSADWP